MMTQDQIELFSRAASQAQDSWFSEALDKLQINEGAGWPDRFGSAIRNWHLARKTEEIRVISLFSGAGGLDIGFHDAGFRILECNEIEDAFAATLRENAQEGKSFEGTRVVCADISDYIPPHQEVDFIIGGPPCQTFSAAGARAAGVNGTDDARGKLFLEYARILSLLKPAGFLFENVYRIVGAQGGKPWRRIQEEFRSLGYKLFWRILDSADYGVPQFRERLVIVGLRSGEYRFPLPSHGPDSRDGRPYFTSAQAIADLPGPIASLSIGGRHGHLLREIPPGLNYSFFTEKLGHPKPIFGWRSKFSDYLYKADPDMPIRTLKAQGGQYTGPFHWDSRVFSVEELKRLQTFPDNYEIVGGRQKVIHQLGNSVPPQFARVLALSIMDQVFDQKLPFKIATMPTNLRLGFRQRKRELTAVYARKAADAIAQLPATTAPLATPPKHTTRVTIHDDLSSTFDGPAGLGQFRVDIIPTSSSLELSLCDEAQKIEKLIYEIEIQPRDALPQNGFPEIVRLRSFSSEAWSIPALWRCLERLTKAHYHKDDLVQLFGYYQYKQLFLTRFLLRDSSLADQPFWVVLSNVSSGIGVGRTMPQEDLAALLGLSQEDLLIGLIDLKRIGFEIRNHNTNRQIEPRHYLVPYSFPSLNDRSLQRMTEL